MTDLQQQFYEKYSKFVVNEKGQLLEVPLRRGVGNEAFIDTLSFTFHESSIKGSSTAFSDEDFIVFASIELQDIFGFGVTNKAKGTGGRFYHGCWEIMYDGVLYGRVHFGGQNETMLVELSGKGCQAATDCWESRLYDWLNKARNPRITRVDVARDFFHEEITPDKAWSLFKEGRFNKRGKPPIVDRYGSDWDCDTQKGKTLYIGSRQSACFARIYDKAKEQGDKKDTWTRFEVQFNGKAAVIDLDVLLVPGQYWAGSFPVCEEFTNMAASRVKANSKRFEISVETCKRQAEMQVGRVVNMMLDLGMSADEIVEELRNKRGMLPERVNPAGYSVAYAVNKSTIVDDRTHGIDVYQMAINDEDLKK